MAQLTIAGTVSIITIRDKNIYKRRKSHEESGVSVYKV